ncbi:HAD-IIIC family phosphatase [Nocardia sp. NPDC058705]|uniref:HAD-IIIC family phosphatase n=1 Tax=Nocardia sp. NPDC058705 TaxID=3346609 RepID=UPI0036B21CDE
MNLLEHARDLRRSGRLEAQLDEIIAGLPDQDDDTLCRIGQLLVTADADAVAGHHPALPSATVCVVGSSTLAPLRAPLAGMLGFRGFVPTIHVGDYAQYMTELLTGVDGEAEADAIVCVLDGQEVFRRLPAVWTPEQVADAWAAVLDELVVAVGGLRERSSCPVLLTTVELPPRRMAEIVDMTSRTQLSLAWREANSTLLRLSQELAGVYVIDSAPILAQAGSLADDRLAAYAQIRFSEGYFTELGREIAAIVAALRGRTSKCLVVDLDGTMWGEVLSEVGPTGVVSGEGPVGECFSAMQGVVRHLAAQGVLLAISSKNDDELVRTTLRDNANVDLGEDDFVTIAADWNPKPGNIEAIAQGLNIGLDSLVFVDDSVSERGSVRTALPSVRVVAVDHKEPALHAHAVLRAGYFRSLHVTADDLERAQRYRAETQRLEFQRSAGSIADYLVGLATRIEITEPTDAEIARISQITLRTNQFNTTTVRRDPSVVAALRDSPDAAVFGVRCTDRYGDHGLIGAAFVEITSDTWHIDNFAMSCRVLGRNVEDAVIAWICRRAEAAGATAVTGAFLASPKNAKAANLFAGLGFGTVSQSAHDASYRLELGDPPQLPPHIEVADHDALIAEGVPTP